jgi:TrmH family RNA methyltransferase
MLSKNRLKYIRSLKIKKNRDMHRQFVVEGDKIVMDLLAQEVMQIDQLIVTSGWLKKNSIHNDSRINEVVEIGDREYEQITMLESPSGIMAILDMPKTEPDRDAVPSGISLALETIQDPGNLGTIIRTASWFGIQTVYCSPDCADLYNPKVVQSSMGAILYTPVCYAPLPELLKRFSERAGYPIYGTFMSGSSIWDMNLSENALIVFGNESKGISGNLLPYISERLHIPHHQRHDNRTVRGTVESLNVAAAAAIVCAAFRCFQVVGKAG